jgi:hypothetical protein
VQVRAATAAGAADEAYHLTALDPIALANRDTALLHMPVYRPIRTMVDDHLVRKTVTEIEPTVGAPTLRAAVVITILGVYDHAVRHGHDFIVVGYRGVPVAQ